MEITYHGLSHFRLRGRETQVVVDPPESALPGLAKSSPDIVVRTGGVTDAVQLRSREGFAQEVAGPGEYEVRGVAIHGLPAAEHTIMSIEIDDVRVVTIGTLQRQLTEEEIDTIGHVDVLVLPVGGGDSLDASAAAKMARALEPAVVIPVRYRAQAGVGDQFSLLESFAKEMGVPGGWAPQPKLNLTGSMSGSEETRVVVLEPRV